jgi:4-hydroxy-3-polyprenylbenzoate decarboxylase
MCRVFQAASGQFAGRFEVEHLAVHILVGLPGRVYVKKRCPSHRQLVDALGPDWFGKPRLPGEFRLSIVRQDSFAGLKVIVAITGASGALYAQRLLDNLDPRQHDIHVVITGYGQAVIAQELPDGLRLATGVKSHNVKSMNAPFASGSNPFDAMVVIPCSMGTLGRIAHGTSQDVLLRAADVMLKERRKLILVPREMPLNLVHVKNFELLLQAGATILPANPCFYTRPQTIEQVVDTVVARVLDHLAVPQNLMPRWQEEQE